MMRQLLIGVAASLLLGCGSSAPVRYYSLPSLPLSDRGANQAAATATLAVGPLRVAEYLDRPQIVTLGPGAVAEVDEFARWVEPPGDGVHRVLASNLAELLPELVVVAYPYGAGLRPDYRLTGRINRLDCSADGQAVLEVQWTVARPDREAPLLGPAAAHYAGACNGSDPAGVAASLGAVLADFSRELAERLRNALAQLQD